MQLVSPHERNATHNPSSKRRGLDEKTYRQEETAPYEDRGDISWRQLRSTAGIEGNREASRSI